MFFTILVANFIARKLLIQFSFHMKAQQGEGLFFSRDCSMGIVATDREGWGARLEAARDGARPPPEKDSTSHFWMYRIGGPNMHPIEQSRLFYDGNRDCYASDRTVATDL